MLSTARGYLVLGRRTPLRLHWTIPVGALVLGGFEPRPWFWLAFFVLTLVHELGHAFLVWRFRKRVVALDVHGLGGVCHWSGAATPFEDAAIAWGGVLAQALVLVAALVARLVAGPPTAEWSAELYYAFTRWNLTMIAINLLPFGPLDGARAWRIVPLLREHAARRASGARGLGGEVQRRVTAPRSGRDADVFELGQVRDARQKKALEDVDAEIRAIVEKAQRDKNRLN